MGSYKKIGLTHETGLFDTARLRFDIHVLMCAEIAKDIIRIKSTIVC